MKVCGIILAGGNGTRLWPLSTPEKPKQFLKIFDNKSLIELTVLRLSKLINFNSIYIVTTNSQYPLILQALKHLIPKENIIVEPEGKNTAPCICYASMLLKEKYGDCITAIFPSDAYIFDESLLLDTIQNAINIAKKKDSLLTIGITPSAPITGYGYINYDAEKPSEFSYPVISFTEKPNIETAIKYLEAGTYLWNSGIFIWKTSIILNEFRHYLPNIVYPLDNIISDITDTQKISDIYAKLPSISIDYGILENSQIISVVPGNFGWSDVGCFDLLKDCLPHDSNNNVFWGKHYSFDCNNFFSISTNKTVIGINVKDIILVEDGDTILLCKAGKSSKIGDIFKKITNDLIRKKDKLS